MKVRKQTLEDTFDNFEHKVIKNTTAAQTQQTGLEDPCKNDDGEAEAAKQTELPPPPCSESVITQQRPKPNKSCNSFNGPR